MLKVINVKTSQRNEIIDITSEVAGVVQKSGIKNGLCVVFNPHTTAAITINENADPSVKRDLLKELSEIVPKTHDYTHSEGNSDSHIKASLVGSDRSVIIENNRLLLGTWQGIFFCEFDGPRSRKAYIKVIAD